MDFEFERRGQSYPERCCKRRYGIVPVRTPADGAAAANLANHPAPNPNIMPFSTNRCGHELRLSQVNPQRKPGVGKIAVNDLTAAMRMSAIRNSISGDGPKLNSNPAHAKKGTICPEGQPA